VTSLDLTYAAIAAIAGLALLWLCRTPKPPYLKARWDDERGDWVNEQPHDVGPDGLRLLETLEADLKAYGAEVADYYDTTTGDPK
jgi:hypothetical protein